MPSSHYCLSAPTREIRLLDLLSATASGKFAGRLRRVAIGDDAPPFVSVSHVWGHEKAKNPLHITSGCGDKEIEISRNLESLLVGLLCHDSATLPQLWDNGSLLPMWIDMACINQSDVGEKASQIPLMRHIYSQATSVIIWINEYDTHLRYAFRYLRQEARDKPGTENEQIWTLFDPLGWDAVKRFINCEWFHRRWVVQEAAVPKDAIFLCGPDAMTMADLFSGIDIIVSALMARPKEIKMIKFATVGSVRPILARRELKKSLENKRQLSLLWLLENLRYTRSTVAHDQIYGLLGLCTSEEVAGNPIRYDLEAEDVFKTCVVTHARLYNDLEFLGLCAPAKRDILCHDLSGSRLSRPFGAPSWVPNWHSKSLRRCLGLHGLDPHKKFFIAPGGMTVEF